MGEWSTSVVEVGGYGLRTLTGGNGAPILVLEDVLGPYGRDAFLEAMAGAGAVCAPVHPGFDGTPQPAWLDNVSDLANFYLDFLDARNLRGVHLIGLGLGGWIAADLATRNTSRLASLSLVNAGGLRLKGVPQCDVFLGSDDEVLRKVVHDRAVADRVIAAMITPESEDIRLQNQQFSAKLTWEPRLHDPHLGKWLHRIGAPTLVAWGANNALYPRPYGEAWAKAIPGALLEVIPDCGHLPRAETPAALAAIISKFISERRAAA